MVPDAHDRLAWKPGEQADRVLELLERRRLAIDQVMWQTPALIVAAQAFLFIVALNPATPDWGRIAVMAAGLFAVSAAAHSLAKQRYLEVLHSQAIKRCLSALGLPGIYRDDLADLWSSRALPGSSDYTRGLLDLERVLGGDRYRKWIVTRASYEVWLVAFGVFALVDCVILTVTLVEAI